MLDAVCCLGEMKNVPSISGYLKIICKKSMIQLNVSIHLSKMIIWLLQRTQGTLFIL